MIFATLDLVEWLAMCCRTTPDAVELWLWVALLVGMLSATVQFILMMVTRWGNSDPTRKALLCSVLIHLSLTSGVVVVSPPHPVLVAATRQKKEQPKEIRKVIIEGEERIEVKTGGNTPVWEQLPDMPSPELSRLERAPLEFQPLQGPERRNEDLASPDLELPDLKQVPDMPLARPEIQQTAELGPQIESAAPLKVDDLTAEARPEVNVPTLSNVRRNVQQSGLNPVSVERQPTQGQIDQVSPAPDLNRQLASIDAPSSVPDAPSAIPSGSADDKIQRRKGPIPAEFPAEGTGTMAEARTSDSAAGSVGPPKFSRLKTRTPKMEELGGVQRFQPEKTPSTPSPAPGPVVSVREGIASVAPVDGKQPNAVRPNFDPIRRDAATTVPPTYRLRNLARRAETARQYGGTDASERAVEASLKWLALHQNPEGFWDADGFMEMCPDGDQCRGRGASRTVDENGNDRPQATSEADVGITGLVVLAFLGAGYTHEEGPYADQVDRALSWLIRQQASDGYLGGKARRFEQMYCHAMATYAIAEALGMQTDRATDRRLRIPLERAVQYILDQQNPTDGGWRYEKGQRSDMSMFGWQLMALKSAEIAGLRIPEENRQLMIKFLKERSLGARKGLAAYRVVDPPYEPLPPTPSMTAEALFCKQMLGIARTNPQSLEAIEYLMNRLPSHRTEDIYYWYYATLAAYQYGGEEWRRWNTALRDYLIADQRTTGHAAGSWDPKAPWGDYGGRVFSTALSALSLEVYYRFLPLYQVQKGAGDLENE